MTLRLLAPADPIRSGRLATVRARFLPDALDRLLATWDWEDGPREEAELAVAAGLLTRRTHRYANSGVYRVRVGMGEGGGPGVRYVTVRGDGQVAGSGWVRDPELREPVPFGFLITPASPGGDDVIALRALVAGEEVAATELTWLFATEPGSVHFGGTAAFGDGPGRHAFRVDVHAQPGSRPRQQLTMSLYAPGAVPGRDSPVHRVSGPIRPGRVDLAALPAGGGPGG